MPKYEFGNPLRGWSYFEAPSDAEAWEYARRIFMRALPLQCDFLPGEKSSVGRELVLKRFKHVPICTIPGAKDYVTIVISITSIPWQHDWYEKL